jgi:hypothetical protein
VSRRSARRIVESSVDVFERHVLDHARRRGSERRARARTSCVRRFRGSSSRDRLVELRREEPTRGVRTKLAS